MSVTKHSAELCTLLVHDVYGELPARILAGLFNRGPSTVTQLGQLTSLSPRHLRHGLAVLVQQSLIYHHTNPTTEQTVYQANPDTSYNLIRLGKIIDLVGQQYGAPEKEIVQTLAALGHAQVADLAQAFSARAAAAAKAQASKDSTSAPEFDLDDTSGESSQVNNHAKASAKPTSAITSTWHLHEVIAQLIQAEILDVIVPGSMRKLHDVYDEIEQEFNRKHKDASARVRADTHLDMIRKFKEARAQTKHTKAKLDSGVIASKRRKLNVGSGSSFGETEFEGRQLESGTVVRINYEKCIVDLRNERLARFAADAIGETTGQVFGVLLRILTKGLSRCRIDPRVDAAAVGDSDGFSGPPKMATTLEILDQLSPLVNVRNGIGKADKAKIDKDAAEKLRITAHDTDDEADSENENGPVTARPRPAPVAVMDIDSDDEEDTVANGTEAADSTEGGNDSRTAMLRQHLLLLTEHKYKFVRHCGVQGRGQWTVDFDMLLDTLRQVELDAIIAQSFGRHGLRLTRILQQKGRLDEKTLASLALMKKQAVQNKILDLQQGGFVEIQEVPRDNNRMANRTMFFWFCDPQVTRKAVVERLQKMILRCLERLEFERRAEKDLLEYVNRSDVKGNEEQKISPEHFERYGKFLRLQSKIMGEVMRLDDMAALFSDY